MVFSLVVACVDIFSCLWGGFRFQAALHFNLVRRGIVLSKSEFYFCEEFGHLSVSYLWQWSRECFSVISFWGQNCTSCLLSAAKFVFMYCPVFMPPVCSLSLTLCLSLLMMSGFYCVSVVTIKVFESRIYSLSLCLLSFHLLHSFPPFFNLEFSAVLISVLTF